ncbi:MAG: TIGR03364 family FAD-dependent oxidoreductase [Planctomycetota bacterium]|nr:TIGR03364 family FAD-dependent oxidoreductase [Planctomycetota bacterium]
MHQADVAVVGAGIVGMAQAYAAAQRGVSVVVFDRDPQAIGASIRNFGMIWPVGQPSGKRHRMALRSRAIWLKIAAEAGFWIQECGSVHLAHHDDEWNVLQEFHALADSLGYETGLLTPNEVMAKSPAANPDGLRGGLWSPTELCVDPREAVRTLPAYLHKNVAIEFRFGTTVRQIDGMELETSDGQHWRAEQIIVANGSDFETLFPELFAKSSLKKCKLQMLRTRPQPEDWRIGPHLASGLTLRHYANFSVCPSLEIVKHRIADEQPLLDKFGIHVMAAQNRLGEVIIGDSHEYGDVFTPVCSGEIDQLILNELASVITLKDWTIGERWFGVYAKHPEKAYFVHDPYPGVKIVTGLGGGGMTLSFGLADSLWGV